MDKTIKVAVYCRLALKDDERIEQQKTKVLKYAEEHGYAHTTVYIDNGKSGSDFNRLAFSQMNDDIKAGKINAVIVQSIDRIGRNSIDVDNWLCNLEKMGVNIEAVDGSINHDCIGIFQDIIQSLLKKSIKGGCVNGS